MAVFACKPSLAISSKFSSERESLRISETCTSQMPLQSFNQQCQSMNKKAMGHTHVRSNNYTVFQKKEDTKLLAITFTNLSRFSKFFHC